MIRQKSTMAAKAFALIATVCLSWSSFAQTTDADKEKLTVRSDAPDRYTVQKGDTLWGIAGKYLDKPWRWPDIWNMNKDQIKNPHRIYPGDVIVLLRNGNNNGEPRLEIEKISPTGRVSQLPHVEIPSIPPGDIEPFLTRSFIAGPDGLAKAAEIVEARARTRVLQGTNDLVYAIGVTPDKGTRWNLFRPGKPIRDMGGKLLGVEYRYLGNAEVERFGSDTNEVSTIRILSSSEEISVGDRLMPVPSEVMVNYAPHAPTQTIEAFIVSSFRGASEMGRGEIVVIDQGEKQGVEVGHVLAVYRQIAPIADPRPNTAHEQIVRGFDQTTWYKQPNFIKVPDERIGLLFVFRTFENASYAIMLNTTDPTNVGDFVRNP